GCTFTALVLRGRVAHVLHVGDTRAYRWNGDRLSCLTADHVAGPHVLSRALGVEGEVRLDYATQPMALHDRFLLCSDGVHGALGDAAIAAILGGRSAPAAPTIAPRWCSTSSPCRRRARPISARRCATCRRSRCRRAARRWTAS